MALWQYRFHILTLKSFNALNKEIRFVGEDMLFNEEPFWNFEPINKNYFDDIGKIIREGKSWSKEIKQFGNIESNCLEVSYDFNTNNVEAVSFRIDFTSEYELVLRQIVEFCIYKELIILDEEYKIVPLNYESITYIINNSPQFIRLNEIRS